MVIAYGCCVGTWNKFTRNIHVRNRRDRPVIALSGQTSITQAYNRIIKMCQDPEVEALVLLHDDLEITDPAFEEKVRIVLSTVPDVALVGVCGGKGRGSLAWWNSPTIGHQMTDSGMLDFGDRFGEVAFIEGSLMVLSRWAIENLRFDERYPGFLGYDDICLHALDADKKIVVADIDTHHHSTLGFKSPAVARAWGVADEIFRKKWGL